MKKRLFGLLVAAVCLPISAFAEEFVEYETGLVDQLLEDGKTVFVDYAADWCSTCKSQERTIKALRADNPKYDEAMVFVQVDWDEFKNQDITLFHDVPRRSTLLLLRGDEELGRLIAGTSRAAIQELLDAGLQSGNGLNQ